MNKQLQNMNNSQMVSGIALVSTAALSVYSIKNIIDLNRKMEEVMEDMEKIKQFITENQRKNNITSSNLGKRLEEVQGKFYHVMNKMSGDPPPVPSRREEKIHEILVDDDQDDIDSTVSSFLN
jgi:hypothetical protein